MKQPAMAKHKNNTSGLGELLRRAREGRGLTLEQISNETKISRRHLQALEQDNAAAIPVEFYRRAAIRAYARAVRLDQNIVSAELQRAAGPSVAPEPVIEKAKGQKPTLFRKRVLIAVGVLLAAVAFGRGLVDRERARERDALVRSVDSRDSAKSTRDTAFSVVTSQRPEPEGLPVASSLPAPDKPPPAVAIEATGVGASTASKVDSTSTTHEGGPPVALPLPPPDKSPAVANETTGVGASAASNDEQASTTEGEPRVSADSVTELIVSTQPEGARVTVDGIGWGTAPVTIRYLPVGEKRIRVTKEGYATEERTVRLGEGHATTVDIELHSAP